MQIWAGLADMRFMQPLMDLIEAGALDPSPMVTHRTSIDDIGAAFERFSDPASGVIKYAIGTVA